MPIYVEVILFPREFITWRLLEIVSLSENLVSNMRREKGTKFCRSYVISKEDHKVEAFGKSELD